MADFYQTGCVTTLQRLKPGSAARMENELREMADRVSTGASVMKLSKHSCATSS